MPILTGKRVILRPVEEGDLNQLLSWYNDPAIFPFMGRAHPLTPESQKTWFETECRNAEGTIVFAVETIAGGQLAGSITLRNLLDPARRAELGILVGPIGSGYGSDAIRTLLKYAFHERRLNCVSLEVRGDNRRAITAYMRAGFRPEGVLRRRMFKDGAAHDVYAMSILLDEFLSGNEED